VPEADGAAHDARGLPTAAVPQDRIAVVPAELVDFLAYLFSDVLGSKAYVTDGVQRGAGRPARDFTDYATRTAATGIWTQATDR
jgi:hypothetical protein